MRRSSIAVVSLIVLVSLVPSATGQDAVKDKKNDRPRDQAVNTPDGGGFGGGKRRDPPVVRVFQLRGAQAKTMAILIDNNYEEVNANADDRTNTIIVTATRPEVLDQIAKLVAETDERLESIKQDQEKLKEMQRREAVARRQTRAFQLAHIPAQEAARSLNQLGLDFKGSLMFSADSRKNQLIVNAIDRDDLAIVEAVLKKIDEPVSSPPAAADLRVRVVWLVSNADKLFRDAAVTDPPADLKESLDELSKHGVTDLKVAAQTIVNVGGEPGSKFSAAGAAKLQSAADWKVEGSVTKNAGGSIGLSMQMSAESHGSGAAMGDKPGTLCRLTTALTTSPGHTVVLGVTPSGLMTSVFVVQVLPTSGKGK